MAGLAKSPWNWQRIRPCSRKNRQYRLIVSVAGTHKGSQRGLEYAVSVRHVKPEVLVKDKLTAADPIYARQNNPHKVHTIKLQANTIYQIDHRSKDFDAFLFLEDSDQNLLLLDDDGGGDRNARIIFRPNKTGTYRVIATAIGPIGNGNYSLSVIENPHGNPAQGIAGPIPGGTRTPLPPLPPQPVPPPLPQPVPPPLPAPTPPGPAVQPEETRVQPLPAELVDA